MKTPETNEFESHFYSALRKHINKNHQGLRCFIAPAEMFNFKGRHIPAPDLIVQNQATGKLMAIEVKGSRFGQTLPYATVPRLKALKEALGADASVVLVSGAEVTQDVRSWLQNDHIDVAQASDVFQAIAKIESNLEALENVDTAR
jgi:hypothetical protein